MICNVGRAHQDGCNLCVRNIVLPLHRQTLSAAPSSSTFPSHVCGRQHWVPTHSNPLMEAMNILFYSSRLFILSISTSAYFLGKTSLGFHKAALTITGHGFEILPV